MNDNKTIFIVVDQGFSSRYLLRTDVFRALKQSGHRIVILAPNADEDYFQNEFNDQNIFTEKYEVEKYAQYQNRSFIQNFLKYARFYGYNKKYYNNCSVFWFNLFFY